MGQETEEVADNMSDLYIPSRPSLETRWVSRRWKHLPQPIVIYDPDLPYSGQYISPSPLVETPDGSMLPCRNGAIIVCPDPTSYIPGTIAHELRHHYQHYRGMTYDGIGWDTDNIPADPFSPEYQSAVCAYFSRSWCELDALRFELKVAPDEMNALWWGWVWGVRCGT